MKKIIFLLSILLLLNGCAESIALIGTSTTKGKIVQSSVNSAISYGVKKQTGKSPLQHAKAYADKKNPDKKQIPLINTELAKNSLETLQKLPEINKIKETSLIEKIAKKSVIYNRR
tara:strand:+ start:776 stop:1123 length:348 start_codon:yes stop_codon:yes gene_type:complete